jgi:hypothetical protein
MPMLHGGAASLIFFMAPFFFIATSGKKFQRFPRMARKLVPVVSA